LSCSSQLKIVSFEENELNKNNVDRKAISKDINGMDIYTFFETGTDELNDEACSKLNVTTDIKATAINNTNAKGRVGY
jgi:hypothetical protein